MNVTQYANFKDDCTGCLACVKSCPVNCIEYSLNEDGFYYPSVDSQKCVDCSKCTAVCSIDKHGESVKPVSVLAGFSKDDATREMGSSGGFVVELSKQIVDEGGIVFGAAFDPQKKCVHHISTDDVPLERLSRSKYVQSNTADVYPAVKEKLQEGRAVLFCGTPCQTEGLKGFLGKSYENLTTVDFFCHGVPSVGFFGETLAGYEKQYGKNITDVAFRDKQEGWHSLALSLNFDDGTQLRIPSSQQPYYYYFLNNYSLRKSCYSCSRYKAHVADITVADYWLVDKKIDDNKGISLVLVNTPKGEAAVNKIESKFNRIPVDGELDFSIYEHKYSSKNREMFFEAYKTKGFEYVCENMFKSLIKKKNPINILKRKILQLLRK